MRTGKHCAAARFGLGLFLSALVACAALAVAGCSRELKESDHAHDVQERSQPVKLTADDLKRLRWIEGAWRGTGDAEKPFYERYRFEGDTTLVVESFPDETLSKTDDVTRFELRDGAFGNFGDGSRWAATALDDTSITFSPVQQARNTFRWQRGDTADAWTATLDWPADGNKPARRRVYRMERLKSK